MTIQQLRTAIEAARTGSITRAAKNLYLSQPNASSVLRTLEQELGYEIFSRTNSGIVPTEAGLQFLEHAKIILAQMPFPLPIYIPSSLTPFPSSTAT